MNLLSINAVCVICAVLLVMTVIPPTSATTGGESDSLLQYGKLLCVSQLKVLLSWCFLQLCLSQYSRDLLLWFSKHSFWFWLPYSRSLASSSSSNKTVHRARETVSLLEWNFSQSFCQTYTTVTVQVWTRLTDQILRRNAAHTLCPQKTCDYIFYHNFNNKVSDYSNFYRATLC